MRNLGTFERGKNKDDDLAYLENCCSKYEFTDNLGKGSVLRIPKSFVGIDFETLYPQRVSACSVGMVKYNHGEIVDRYYTLIRPPFDYPNKKGKVLTWIHGIKENDVCNERTFAEILPEIEEFVEDLPLVAHHACVERACIKDTTSFYGLDTTLNFENIIDTYTISLIIEKAMGFEIKGEGTHSLDAVCRRFGVPEMRHHNALDDAEMCGNLLLAFENVLSDKNFELQEAAKTPAKKKEKYKAEDKVQRADLENIVGNPFKGCAVVLTGFAVTLSQEYGHKLKELGAKVCTGVSRKTKWLICGPNAGPSKKEKAQEVGAQIISEETFLILIQNIE